MAIYSTYNMNSNKIIDNFYLHNLFQFLILSNTRGMVNNGSAQWQYIKRILGECLLISSLPGKALRTLVDIARLAEQFNMHSQSQAW